MTVPRFIVARAAGDSVILRDTERKRLAAIFPRDTNLPEAQADAAANRMAELCAQVLNRAHQAVQAKQQQEGSK